LEGVIDAAGWDALQAEVTADVTEIERIALAAPKPDPATALEHVSAAPSGAPVTLLPEQGRELAFGLAVNLALHREMADRPEVVTFGEDIAIPGGTFGVTRGLRKEFGERVFDTPIAEASILGAALGASLEGLRPVVEIMWTDFLFVAFDQIVNQMSNVRYISRGAVSAPLVVRMQQGVTPGSCAQHSQSLEALIAHIPGIKVGLPSNPQDAYAMLRAAVADPDPVVIIESRALYQDKALIDPDAPIEAVAGARLWRSGSDLLIVSWGRMAQVSLRAADRLADEGISASVLDLRWLNPLDEEAIAAALKASAGRLLIAHEANLTGGFGAEIAARVSERHLFELDAPIVRVGMPDVRVPSSPVLQAAILPSEQMITDAARRLVGG
ncbi:MAG: transketolase C-terminal domain-containing protein, partial [Chloroflexota bacterium]